MSTSVDEFLSYLLGKFDSKIYSDSDECIIVERVRYSSEHCYPINTTRYQIFPDGRIITFVRDDVEGSDFRERNRFHLQHVTIESKETHHIEKLGWDEPPVIETHPIYPFAQVGPISAFIAEGDKNLQIFHMVIKNGVSESMGAIRDTAVAIAQRRMRYVALTPSFLPNGMIAVLLVTR